MSFKPNEALIELKRNGKYFTKMMNIPVAEDYKNRILAVFGPNFPDVNPIMFDTILFSLKRIETSRFGSKDYTDKLISYQDPKYSNSKSNKNIEDSLEKVRAFLSTVDPTGLNGVLQLIGKNEKISAGAFVYAYEGVIEEKSKTIITVIPNNLMANYQRVSFMVMDIKQASAVAISRLRISITVMKVLSKFGITINAEDVLDNSTKAKAVERWSQVFPKFIEAVPFATPQEALSVVPLEINLPYSTLTIDELLAGSFPVNYHMILQNREFRQHERKPCDINLLRKHVNDFLIELFTYFGKQAMIQKGLDVMDKNSPVAQQSWVFIKCLKFITKVIRPARKAGFLKQEGKPIQGVRRTRLIL